MYHIASTFISGDAMKTSMERAMQGSNFYFTLGPAVVGLIVHMMTGLVWGVVFGLIAWSIGLRGIAAPVVGIVYGLGVMVVDSFVPANRCLVVRRRHADLRHAQDGRLGHVLD